MCFAFSILLPNTSAWDWERGDNNASSIFSSNEPFASKLGTPLPSSTGLIARLHHKER
jgi:hypothetical protein